MFVKTAANSLIRCGLLPVFSSCSITPMTISSLTSSVSTLLSVDDGGDGGGVCSYAALPLDFGRSAKETTFTEDDDDREDRGFDDDVGDESEVCDRLIFFDGGECGCVGVSVGGETFETEGR